MLDITSPIHWWYNVIVPFFLKWHIVVFLCLLISHFSRLVQPYHWNCESKGNFSKDVWLVLWFMWFLTVFWIWFWFLFILLSTFLPTQTWSEGINPWKVHLIHNFYFCAAQTQICCPFCLADLHLFNWAVCQKPWPAWVIEAFIYLHSWHSLCISSVGWGFPGPCMDVQRRTNRKFITQEWKTTSDDQ